MSDERLEKLLDGYFDEGLDTAEQSELEALLLSQPHARDLFWRRARFNALLRRRGREMWGRRMAQPEVRPSLAERLAAIWRRLGEHTAPRWTWVGMGAATALLIFAATAHFLSRPGAGKRLRDDSYATAEPANYSQGVATLLRAVEVQWTDGKPAGGNVLSPGWLKFQSGLVELQFHRGATVLVEGPAELELISDMQVRCLLGKVRADVPPSAVGFEVLTPNVRVVDRGTEFGMEVKRGGEADVHVFTGKVDLAYARPPGGPKELTEGAAVRVDANGASRSIPIGNQVFPTLEAVGQRANGEMARQFARWKAHTETLRKDPSVLVHYTFEGEKTGERILKNQAIEAEPETDGAIIGCRWTEGRWPGKRALDFKQLGDRIRFSLPREHTSLTCFASLRLDALDHTYIALLMSGDGAVGELQWQMEGIGAVSLGKRIKPGWGIGRTMKVNTGRLLNPQRCGSWLQVAFVYDASSRTVTQYLDGKLAGGPDVLAGAPPVTGSLEVGNWTPVSGQPMEPIRNFNGRMDEFVMFSRALSEKDIEAFWEAGRPY